MPNEVDACPGLSPTNGGIATPTNGFHDVRCFTALLPQLFDLPDPRCTLVAARKIDEFEHVDALRPASKGGYLPNKGVVFVGVVNDTMASAPPFVILEPASAASVEAGFRNGSVPADALFACLLSVEFEGHSLSKNPQAVYGYRLAATYVRSLLEAGRGKTKAFRDGVGLFREIRKNTPKWLDGIAGTNGTLWDTSHFDIDPAVLDDVQLGDLPSRVVMGADRDCYAFGVGGSSPGGGGGGGGSGPVIIPPEGFGGAPTIDPPSPPYYAEVSPWKNLPDPGPEGYDHTPWPGHVKGYGAYKLSPGGQVMVKRWSAFGPRPIESNFAPVAVAMSNDTTVDGMPPQPSTELVNPPSNSPTHVAPPPGPPGPPTPKPKFGPGDQFSQKGSVGFVDWGGIDPAALPLVCDIEMQCFCPVDALAYVEVGPLATIPWVMFDHEHPFESWEDFFQDKKASPPRTMMRALDDLSRELMGGDSVLVSMANNATSMPALWVTPHIKPVTFNLLSPLPSNMDQAPASPPGLKIDFTPQVASGWGFPSPYSHGVWVESPPDKKSDWTFVSGTAYSVLTLAGATKWPKLRHWFTDVGDHRVMSLSRGGAVQLPATWDEATQEWKQSGSLSYQSMTDQIDASIPLSEWSTSQPYDFGEAGGKTHFVSRHLVWDKWNPGGDRWQTNSGNKADFDALDRDNPGRWWQDSTGKPIAGNDANWLSPHLAPFKPGHVDNAPGLQPLASYSARVQQCSLALISQQGYSPYDPDQHWPLLVERVPFSGLYGMVHPARVDAPQAKFPSGDLMHRWLTGEVWDKLLHEGSDINWDYKKKYTLPFYRNLFSGTPHEYCYGTPPLLDAADEHPEFAIHCQSEAVQMCGAQATCDNPCNPLELALESLGQACGFDAVQSCLESETCDTIAEYCGPLGFLCETVCDVASCTLAVVNSVTACINEALIEFHSKLAGAYLGNSVCLAVIGKPCSDESLSVHRCGQADDNFTIELEHRAAFAKSDGEGTCDDANDILGLQPRAECSSSVYPQLNAVWAQGEPPNAEDLSGRVCVDGMLVAYGWMNSGKSISQLTYPFVLAPGAMHTPSSLFSYTALTLGEGDPPPAMSLLGEKLGADIFAKAHSSLKEDRGFRIDFLGDLITDCGHNPLRNEIHPPTNIVLHLTPTSQTFGPARRYSVYMFDRGGPSTSAPSVPIELWPGPRPAGAKTPVATVLTEGAAIPSKLSCGPHPPASPSRVRCTMTDATYPPNWSVCEGNPRMLPSCGVGFAGGIVEVTWK